MNNNVSYSQTATRSKDDAIIANMDKPFSQNGGIRVLKGNLGTSVIKVSAVDPENWYVKAEAIVI